MTNYADDTFERRLAASPGATFERDPVLDPPLPTADPYYQTWLTYVTQTRPDARLFNAQVAKYGEKFLKVAWYVQNNDFETEDAVTALFLRKGMQPVKQPSLGGGGPSKAQQYAAAEAAIKNQAYTLGYTTITDARIKNLARTVVDQNWSGEQLNETLVNEGAGSWDKLTGGTILAAVDAVKAGAAQQLIAISDATARQWAKRVASGELDAEGLVQMLQAQAAARYGWAADVIQSGMTMSDFLAPSRDRIAQELEMNPEEVSLMDPKIMNMMTVVDNGKRRVANDTEIIRNVRSDERWKSTGNARSTLASAAMMLRRYVEGT